MKAFERKALEAANRICKPPKELAKKKELWKKIGELTGSQARIVLAGILDGKSLPKAIETAKTFPD